jgi:hypothetical protein
VCGCVGVGERTLSVGGKTVHVCVCAAASGLRADPLCFAR